MTTDAWRPSRSARRKKKKTQTDREADSPPTLSRCPPPVLQRVVWHMLVAHERPCEGQGWESWEVWVLVGGVGGGSGRQRQQAAKRRKEGRKEAGETLNTASQLEVSIKFQCLTESVSSPRRHYWRWEPISSREKGSFAFGGFAAAMHRRLVRIKRQQNWTERLKVAATHQRLEAPAVAISMPSLPEILPVPVCD